MRLFAPPESLPQTKKNILIGFWDLVSPDDPGVFEVPHLFMLFTHSFMLFFFLNHHVVFCLILAQCEALYEPCIRCVNCTRHTSDMQHRCRDAGFALKRESSQCSPDLTALQ